MQKILAILIGASTLFLAIFRADGYIGTSYQMQLGNPSGATTNSSNHDHYLIQRTVEAMDYSDNLREPNWASWDLTSDDVGNSGRSSDFFQDASLPAGFYEVSPGEYSGSGYERGHMCPSGDRTDNSTDNDMVFLMSNIIPQATNNNEGIWANFEDYCRTLAQSGNEILIICGPSGFDGSRTPATGSIAIPAYTWKIAVVVAGGTNDALSRINNSNRVIAIKVPNNNSVSSVWQNYVTNAAQIQADTGFTFFTALTGPVASALRYKVDGQTFPAPVINNFSPVTAAAGQNVIITGTNFGSALAVTFNGVSATYSVDSAGQITAQVPVNATAGQISVTTASGTATSLGTFTFDGAPFTDLAVLATHSGNFTQGDAADTYTLVVTNLGTLASSGTITVTDSLPAGLTATAISGSGWTSDLATLTSTRSDSLAAGAGYPPIIVTVTVAANAPATVTNQATVSGGGDTNVVNNSASNLTQINSANIPTATTGTATSVRATTATLNGTIDPNAQSTTVKFEWGLTTNYDSSAIVSGSLTGTTAQAASANLTGLTPSTTYHFRVDATNVLGATNGLDQTFVTTANIIDLALLASHVGNFTQGDTADTYSIIVTNLGALASSGTVTISDSLPAGLIATAISGAGWATNLATLTCTRSDSLAAGASYPPIVITVSVATNAPVLVTNSVTVSGGNDANLANNTANDPTAIIATDGSTGVTGTLVGWDVNALTGYGPSPFAPTTNAANLTVVGLTRGSGIITSGSAAARAWGGNNFVDTNEAAAISNNRFATFSITADTGYAVSFGALNPFNYRRSGTGPTNGVLQYQIGTGAFTDITPALSYSSSASGGASLGPIDLSGITALQNISGTTVTFRLINWGGTSAGGTWYIYDVTNSTALDFAIQGTVMPVLTPIQSWRQQYFGTAANSGAAADTAIASSDGMPNLLKYAFGLNPLTPAVNPITNDITTGYLRLSTPKNPNATDISFHVELTTALPGSWTTNGTVIDQNTATLLQAHDGQPINSSTSGFLRLRVSRP